MDIRRLNGRKSLQIPRCSSRKDEVTDTVTDNAPRQESVRGVRPRGAQGPPALPHNKTVTRTLDTAQADALRPLLDNARRLRELTSELESLTLQQLRDDPAQPDP